MRTTGGLAAAAAFGAVLALAGCSPPHDSADPPVGTPAAAVSTTGVRIAADLPLLPINIAHSARSPEVVQTVYEFAARHPEVLRYVPCFCGCERGGHRGNADCFVAKRNDRGEVTQWEPHGSVCEICLDVGQMAMQMHNSGASTAAIREAVEARFAGEPNHTPTPMPPGMPARN